MRGFWQFAVLAVIVASVHHVYAEEEPVAIAGVVEESAQPATLVDVDAGVQNGEEEAIRDSRQVRTFGFGRPRPYFGGGGFYRPRPYRPRPFYGGGFYRPPPPPFYGGYYRPPPPPFYGGFYG